MTKLLVSVRNVIEASDALAGGADVVDIKEPLRGPLGPADPGVWKEVCREIGDGAVVSAALGEIMTDNVEELASVTEGLAFAKVGLAGCASDRDWRRRFWRAAERLPGGVQAVPVSYGDWRPAEAPTPTEVLSLAAQLPGRLLLVDTYDKRKGTLLDHLSWSDLRELARAAELVQVRLALAGSLSQSVIIRVLALKPAYVGVRGAACEGGRDGAIDSARVKSLAECVRRIGATAAV
jgi:(5-formylfuran-3-yl)methyl phosphate synthase